MERGKKSSRLFFFCVFKSKEKKKKAFKYTMKKKVFEEETKGHLIINVPVSFFFDLHEGHNAS